MSQYPAATTPNPSVHRQRSSLAPAFSAAQTEAFGEAIVDEVLAQVAFALASVDVLGMKPFAFLQQYGEEMEQKAQAALAAAEGAQTTANNAQTAAGDAQTAADTAQTAAEKASADLTTLINDGLAAMGLSTTGKGADFGVALQTFITDLFGPDAIVGTNTSNIQHSALPSSYDNIHVDLQNLFNDVVFADGRGWDEIGPDVQQLAVDMIGPGATVTVNAPSQIPHSVVSSTSGNASLGDDVAGAVANAATAAGTATAAADTANSAHDVATGAQNTANTVTTAANNLINGVGSFFGADPQTVANIEAGVDPVIDGLSSFFTNLFNPGASTVPNPATSTRLSVATVPDLTTPGEANASGVPTIADNAATAVDKAATANTNAQGVIDSINNAVNGGNATGTPLSQVVANLAAIPQNNIKVNPASGNPAAVTFDAVGAGAASGPYSVTQNGTTVSWTHVIGAGNPAASPPVPPGNYLLVPIYYPGPMSPATPSFIGVATRQSDGQQFLLPQITFSDDTNVLTMLGALIEPGTYTVAVTSNVIYPNTGPGFVCASVSYRNVNTVGITTAHGSGAAGTSMPLSFPSQPNNPRALAVVYWGNTAASTTAAKISGLTGVTQRLSDVFATGSTGTAVALGDAIPVGTNTAFSATAASGAGNEWMAVEILLEPPTETVGSFAHVSRENTTAVSVALGASTIPANSYDTTVKLTDDITFSNGNTLTASLAGTYMLEVGVNFGTVITSPNCFMFEAVVNGVSELIGYAVALANQAGVSIHSVLNLDPGATVTWVATNMTTAATWTFVGNSNGTSWMKLGLMNRSLL
ncbi:hypothetical protein NM962_01145 [Mycobacterium sp. SVM_VP21]|nr:hypothetical protein NM962_01145 [Mycobacterium sp. SVM_VP21]